MKKRRVIFRVFPFNRLTFPILLNSWESKNIDKYFEIIIAENPVDTEDGDVLIYSFMTPHLPLIHKELKELTGKKVLKAGGGPHITGDVELPKKMGFDILFSGEGEETFIQFGRDLLTGEIPKKVKIYNEGEKFVLDKYLPFSKYFKTVPPLEIFRGCFWRCKYCQTGSARHSSRSLSSINSYLTRLKNGGFKRVTFISPSSLEYGAKRGGKSDPEKINELLKTVRSFDFKFFEYGVFPSEIRPETLNEKLALLLRNTVSNNSVTLGGQSGSALRLRELRRGHGVDDIEEGVRIANSAGFMANLDFILGYPDETPAEREETLNFITKMNKKFRIKAHIHHFFPLSGSEYQFRFPSFLSENEKEYLFKLNRDGFSTKWWEVQEKQVKDYFFWLEVNYPEYLSKYT